MHEALTETVAAGAPQPALSSWDEAQARFGDILGVGRPLPAAVLRRAMVDSTFAHRLLVSRNAPGFLNALLDDPANAKYAPPESPAEVEEARDESGFALLGKAALSLARWGATGFTHADAETQERRLDACASCPNLRQPPSTLAYRLAGGSGEKGVCGLCGCPVQRKARMSTEACPDRHPERPGYTRWGEPARS
ncbi:MAG: hypothetical protein JO013_10010 [Alphaproteobacteria bacterium]|nr:hypothetical protein [Alphaproteobacteria bacterium]